MTGTREVMRDESCIFCAILAGQADASFVTREERVSAFLDVQPLVRGHTLVIPNHHTADVFGIDEATGGALFATARKIAAAMPDSGLQCEGFNFFLANGKVAGQTVFHAHLHVIPRHRGDKFGIRIDPAGRETASREHLDTQASALIGAMERQARS
jgi:histidine triad (HIT) family protein